MNLSDFARFFVRFNGAIFVFWAIYTAIDLPAYIRDYSIVHEALGGAAAFAGRDLANILFKIAILLLVAFILLAKTDPVISLLTQGQWKKVLIQPPEPTPGSDT